MMDSFVSAVPLDTGGVSLVKAPEAPVIPAPVRVEHVIQKQVCYFSV